MSIATENSGRTTLPEPPSVNPYVRHAIALLRVHGIVAAEWDTLSGMFPDQEGEPTCLAITEHFRELDDSIEKLISYLIRNDLPEADYRKAMQEGFVGPNERPARLLESIIGLDNQRSEFPMDLFKSLLLRYVRDQFTDEEIRECSDHIAVSIGEQGFGWSYSRPVVTTGLPSLLGVPDENESDDDD